MTTDHYYHYQYSPPVSPKSIPHGFKRKASLQDDEIESNSLISHSFKKLRLSKLPAEPLVHVHALNSCLLDNGKRSSLTEITPVGVTYRDSNASASLTSHLDLNEQDSRSQSFDAGSRHDAATDDDFMPVDDTANRVWINDLDAEIAEIEAAEAQEHNDLKFSETGKEYAKIPEHLLRRNPAELSDSAAANMQVILYRDPISISVPEEEDAVRKTITEARQRMRERQAEERERKQESTVPAHPSQGIPISHSDNDIDEDSMELD